MKLLSLNTVGIALVVLALVIPTGAVSNSEAEDTIWADGGIVLSPADGPNGDYASISSDDNLSVDLSSVGINPNAVTVIADVFRIANQGDEPVRVWVTHDGADAVSVIAGPSRQSIRGNASAIELEPGESVPVGFRIDSRGRTAGETLLRNLRIHAQRVTPSTPTPTAAPGGEQPIDDNATVNGTPTPTETGTETSAAPDPTETTEVVFDVPVDNATVRVEELDSIPEDADRAVLDGPRAVITAENVTSNQGTRDGRQRFDSIVLTNTTAVLDGRGSLLHVSDAIDTKRRLAKVVRITVPESLEHQPATVRMRVNKSRLAGTDPADARIGHRNETGWQLLPTRVVAETTTSVVFEARTPGFSVFGLWQASEVEYRWSVEAVGNRTGQRIDVTFPQPGVYNATLTVTDAFGQIDVTDYRILANDRPNVTLQVDGNLTANTPLNLTAVVRDRLGNTSVTWKFEDGTSLVGAQVVRSFEPGRHVIEIHVADEYGAATTREFVLVVPEPDSASSGSIDLLNASLPAIVQSIIVGGLGLAILILRRRIRPGEAA